MLREKFPKVGIFDFKQLLNSKGEIMSYGDLARLHGLTRNIYTSIKHVKLMSTPPVHRIEEISPSDELFSVLK